MKRIIKSVLILGSVAALLGGAGWYGWRSYAATRDTVTFRTSAVERGDLAATISATGTIEPEEVIDVGAQVAAQIKHFGVDPNDPKKTIDYGTRVHPDTLLAQLDDALFKARVEQAQASVDEAIASVLQADANQKKAEADLLQLQAKVNQAERDWTRAQQLRSSRSIADAEYDLAKSTVETARANVKVGEATIVQTKAAKNQAEKSQGRAVAALHEAEVNLSYTQIRSPVEGVIIDRRVNVGQTVVAGLNAPSLFLIAKDLRRMQVWASVNEADIGNIHEGQPVSFTVDAYPREVFRGQVAQLRLNASMTQNVVTYTVVVTTDNSDGRLKPYMTANLSFEIDRRVDVLLVPNAALRWKPRTEQIVPEARGDFRGKGTNSAKDAESHVLWIADGRYVRPVTVRLGLSDGVQTEIVAGEIVEGAPVVIGSRRASSADVTSTPFAPKIFGGKKS